MRTVPIGKYTLPSDFPLKIDVDMDCAFCHIEKEAATYYTMDVAGSVLISDNEVTAQEVVESGQSIVHGPVTVYCGNVNQINLVAQPGTGECVVRVFAVVTGG